MASIQSKPPAKSINNAAPRDRVVKPLSERGQQTSQLQNVKMPPKVETHLQQGKRIAVKVHAMMHNPAKPYLFKVIKLMVNLSAV